MGLTVDGDSIVISNANITIVNGNNAESGVAYIIITPEGGVGSLPFMATGEPGMPTLFPSISIVEIPASDPLPDPNPTSTLLDAGGPGLPASYALEFYIHKGAQGLPGSPSISGSSDLATAPVLGVGTDKFTLIYRSADNLWVPTAQKVGSIYVSGTIASTAYNSATPRLLSSIAFPAFPWDWRPKVWAATTITGTDGPAPTRVDLFSRLNDASSGHTLGYARGLIGSNPAGIQTIMLPTYLYNQAVPGDYAKVSAGAPATVHLRAEQVAASSSSWSTPASPDTTFTVEVQPIL